MLNVFGVYLPTNLLLFNVTQFFVGHLGFVVVSETFQEFLMGCLRLRGQATAMDVGALEELRSASKEGKSHEISLAAGKSRLVK